MGEQFLEALSGWEGDVDDLARLGGQWCAILRIENRPDLTVRLVRDYGQRGILGRPRRDGKVAIYGWEHLVRLLAARFLLRDGWPLQKIADEFLVRSPDEIRALLPGAPLAQSSIDYSKVEPSRRDPAIDAIQAMRQRRGARTAYPQREPMGPFAQMARMPATSDHVSPPREIVASVQALGESGDGVQPRTFTRLQIADGIELHVETARLRSLGHADAHAISRAVLISLLNPRNRKEDKTE